MRRSVDAMLSWPSIRSGPAALLRGCPNLGALTSADLGGVLRRGRRASDAICSRRHGAMTQQPAGYLCRGGVPDMEVAAYTTVVCLRLVVRSITVLVSWNTCTAWSPVT